MPQGHEDSTGTLPPASAMQACRHQVLSSLAILRSLGGPAIGAHAHAERFGRAEESLEALLRAVLETFGSNDAAAAGGHAGSES